MKVITIASLKGGVGKTTTTVFLAQALQQLGKKIVLIDMDHNNNLTDYYLRNVDEQMLDDFNMLSVLLREKRVGEVCHIGEYDMPIVPATPMLSKIGTMVATDPSLYQIIPTQIRRDFNSCDYVLIDTPPAVGAELRMALMVADLVITPLSVGRWPIQGFTLVGEEVNLIRDINPTIKHVAIRSIVTDAQAQLLNDPALWPNNSMLNSVIYNALAVKNATTKGTLLKSDSQAEQQFNALAKEIIEMEE